MYNVFSKCNSPNCIQVYFPFIFMTARFRGSPTKSWAYLSGHLVIDLPIDC